VAIKESEPVVEKIEEPVIKKHKITKRSLGKWGKK
jgi:hypothetical protein